MALYVKLDVEYASDDKLVEAGPLAELLYIRSLCFAKRNPKSDGAFTRAQLAVIAVGIPQPVKHADLLVESGAWVVTERGWAIPGWLKHNKSGDEIAAQQALASELGVQGNHERWHVGPEGKPSSRCPLCIQTRRTRSQNPIGSVSGTPIGGVSPEEETETEPKEKPEEESKEETEQSPVESVNNPKSVDPGQDRPDGFCTFDDAVIDRIIREVATLRTERMRPDDPTAYHAKVVADINLNERPYVARMLTAKPHRAANPRNAADFYEDSWKPERKPA